MSNDIYKLNTTLYYDEDDNSITDVCWVGESKLWAKKGRLYKRIEVTKENFESLEQEYFINEDCKYIYTAVNGKRNDIYIYSADNDWFDKIKEGKSSEKR